MSLVADIQCRLAHVILAPIVLAVGAIVDSVSAAIDTKEMDALSLGVALDRVFAGTDALTYKFQQSDDGSTAWTDVPVDGNLPFSAEGAIVGDAPSPWLQSVGCFSSDRFVRIVFNGVVETTEINVVFSPVLEDRHRETDRYLVNGLPTDGQP